MLHRLVSGTVLTEEYRVVCQHEDRRGRHQGREPDRRTQVVAEHEERRTEGPEPTVDGQSVDRGTHGVFAPPETEVAAHGIVLEVGSSIDERICRWLEVGGAADESGKRGGGGVGALAPGLSG